MGKSLDGFRMSYFINSKKQMQSSGNSFGDFNWDKKKKNSLMKEKYVYWKCKNKSYIYKKWTVISLRHAQATASYSRFTLTNLLWTVRESNFDVKPNVFSRRILCRHFRRLRTNGAMLNCYKLQQYINIENADYLLQLKVMKLTVHR